ncbi:MAG: hypothetical protein ACE5Q6_10520 [Dehalococcoidia bacterium]
MMSKQNFNNLSTFVWMTVIASLLLLSLGCANLGSEPTPNPTLAYLATVTAEGSANRSSSRSNARLSSSVSERYSVGSWSGSTNKNTETFTIPSHEWTIEWSSADRYFSIAVRDPEGRLVDRAVDLIGGGRDSTIMRGKGRYYLDINANARYTIKVTAFR